jgi:hypothetical protein
MNPFSPPPSAGITESTEPVQFFDCESIPLPPGTKAKPRPGRRRQLPVWVWWLIVAAVASVTGVAGWFLGRA